MLHAAARRADVLDLRNLAFHHAGFLSFDLCDASLDLVIRQFALYHLPDFWKTVALARIRRVLKPSGRLYLCDVVFTRGPDEVAGAVEGRIDWMRENTGYRREEYSPAGWIIEVMIERAGFCLL